jgi:hypothetical protein
MSEVLYSHGKGMQKRNSLVKAKMFLFHFIQ